MDECKEYEMILEMETVDIFNLILERDPPPPELEERSVCEKNIVMMLPLNLRARTCKLRVTFWGTVCCLQPCPRAVERILPRWRHHGHGTFDQRQPVNGFDCAVPPWVVHCDKTNFTRRHQAASCARINSEACFFVQYLTYQSSPAGLRACTTHRKFANSFCLTV